MQASLSTTKKIKRSRSWKYYGLLFILPAFFFHALVVLAPSFSTLYHAFFEWNGLNTPVFVGLGNFRELFFDDAVFRLALRNVVIWTSIFITIPIALGLLVATMVSTVKNSRLQMVYRTICFMPYVLSAAIAGRIWANLYNPYFGVPVLFEKLGLENLAEIMWLGDPKIALYSVAFVSMWHWWGFVMVIFIAALHQIDPVLYEAATVDGCNRLRSFYHITIPGILPTLAFMILLSLMWSVLTFDFIWVMTMGGPAQSTEILSTWIYKNAFVSYRAGYANAMSIIQSGIVLIIFFINQMVRRKTEVEA